MSDKAARQRAVDQIARLGRLIKACDAMIEAEQDLIASAIPYASNENLRTQAALARAAYAVFEVDGLHDLAAELDPDASNGVLPIRAGVCRGMAA